MKKEFSPTWYTIPLFAEVNPVCMYHKEQEEMHGENNAVRNLHVLARADFIITKGKTYILRISADDYYKLYINGQFVMQGPAPAYPEHYYYNEIDISKYLVEGKNVFAVHLYYQGLINRVWNSGDNRFGIGTEIWCAEAVEELSWNYRVSEAYKGGTTGYETQFLENFDSRKWESEWVMPNYVEQGYAPMVEAKWADYRFLLQPTKMLEVYQREPKAIQETSTGLVLDMGEEMTGTLGIKAEGLAGGKVVIRCGEELEEGGGARFDMRCNCRYEEEWTLAEGECYLEQYDYKAFRYVELLFKAPVKIKEVWTEVRHYPMQEDACTFTCSKKELEDIFQICKNAVKYGTQEGYLDCPTREKGQYLGDSIVTAHAQVWLTGSTEMLRKCIEQFANTSQVCKGLMAVAPGALMQEIADFSLLWSQLLLLDYQFTGDKEFLGQYYPIAKEIIEYFKQYEREDGLLCKVADKWNLVDWPENLRDDYDFELSRPVVADGCHNVVNALYVGAIKTLSQIEDILDLSRSYQWEPYRTAFLHTFYNSERGMFVDCEGSSHSAVHSNIYPLYFGLLEEEQLPPIVQMLEEKGLCCGVFVSYFFLKGLAKAGYYDVMYRLLVNESEHGWINMLREGATTCFEAWGKEQKWNTSLCHPWASAPIPLIIEDVAGFIAKMDEKGKWCYKFQPHIPAEIDNFSLRLTFAGESYAIVKKADGSIQCRYPDAQSILQS